MKTIYAVIGTTGEYSDRTEWHVCGYINREKADKHADIAKIWAHEQFEKHIKVHKYRLYECNWDTIRELVSPYDKDFKMDYTGTDYYVVEIEIREEITEESK
jgi:hypothetical protein